MFAFACMDAWPEPLRNALYVVLIVGALLWVLNWVSGAVAHSGSNTARLSMMLKHATRWAAASTQDTSALMAFMHANYAAAYLQLLRELYTEAEIQAALGTTSFPQLQHTVMQLQNSIQAKLAAVCPAVQPESTLEAFSLMA